MTTWTTDRPKVEGIYWMQRPGEPARVVRVWGQCERHGPDMLSMIGSGAWDQMVDRYCPSSTLWYGPIVAPAMTAISRTVSGDEPWVCSDSWVDE